MSIKKKAVMVTCLVSVLVSVSQIQFSLSDDVVCITVCIDRTMETKTLGFLVYMHVRNFSALFILQ